MNLRTIDSESLLKMAYFFADLEGTCLLYSGGNLDSAKISLLFLFPYNTFEIRGEPEPFEVLKSKLDLDRFSTGFLNYEFGNPFCFDDHLKAYFQKSAFILIFNHKQKTYETIVQNTASLSEYAREWIEKFSQQDFLEKWLAELPEIDCITDSKNDEILKIVKDFESLEIYQEKVKSIQEMILDGDVYQVNLSHELILWGKRNPFQVFYELINLNPAPFSAYFKLKDFTLVSSSPERLLCKKENILETRPIKGTIARGKTLAQDLENKEKLLNSTKDQAELLMITDLMRNDLGKVSLAGSVKTLKIAQLEAYQNVYHLLSIIQSNPMNHLHPVDILKACFPGGSITGCPKIIAMKVIKKLENRERGIYTGSIGYFNGSDFDFNIAIRTLKFTDDTINIQLGGAITIDSDPIEEYNETLQKGASIFSCLGF